MALAPTASLAALKSVHFTGGTCAVFLASLAVFKVAAAAVRAEAAAVAAV